MEKASIMISELIRLDTSLPVCPYCGDQEDVIMPIQHQTFIKECTDCGESFEVILRTENFYTANPLNQKSNGTNL